jgi:MFS family permease
MTGILTRRATGPFEYFLLSRSVSWAGNAVSAVALPILMFQETGSAAMSGLLAVCEAVPYLLFGLPAGALVDRWDQRRTMTMTSWLSAAVTATIPLAAAAGILVPIHLLAVATLLAVLFVFFDAASFGTVPALVGRDGIARATARMLTVSTVIGIIGPAVGGVLAAAIGGAWVLALDSATISPAPCSCYASTGHSRSARSAGGSPPCAPRSLKGSTSSAAHRLSGT